MSQSPSSLSRARFATVGLCVALAVAAVAPLVARVLSIGPQASMFALVALALAGLGYVAGARVEAFERRSYEDPVTGLGNRRHGELWLGQEVERALASRTPLSMLVLDVDDLKKLNDAHGHGCGDRALGVVGAVLLETCRSGDVAARFGGDELVVLLPRTRAAEARVVGERILAETARRWGELGAARLPLTVSIGLAELGGLERPSGQALFEAADRALYAAKSAGRGRIEVAKPAGPSGIISLERARAARRRRADA